MALRKIETGLEVDSGSLILSGNISTDIDLICNDLRRRLHEQVEEARAEALQDWPDHTMFSFAPGRQDSASAWFNMITERPETTEEIEARLAKERKAEIRKQKAKLAAREKDLKTIRELAIKHNLPLQINQEALSGAIPAGDQA